MNSKSTDSGVGLCNLNLTPPLLGCVFAHVTISLCLSKMEVLTTIPTSGSL
jgi:hypothetical protein